MQHGQRHSAVQLLFVSPATRLGMSAPLLSLGAIFDRRLHVLLPGQHLQPVRAAQIPAWPVQPRDKQPLVTKHTILIVNSLKYIGSTTDMQRRYREHSRTPPSRMRHDADLYPFQANFLMTELARTYSMQKVNQLEYHYIKHHVTQASQGYNIAKQDPTHTKQFWYPHRRGLM